jgi:hypothetical protein
MQNERRILDFKGSKDNSTRPELALHLERIWRLILEFNHIPPPQREAENREHGPIKNTFGRFDNHSGSVPG